MNILDVHLAVPETGQFIVYLAGLFVLNCPTDSVVSTREVALGLEFDVGNEIVLWAPHVAVVAQLVFHLSEKNAAGVHIRLRQDARPD